MASIFYVSQNPKCFNSFLDPFVNEILDLESTGILQDEVNYSISIRCIITDAPARSFIKRIKNHNAQYGCVRCYRRGTWSKRVIYPIMPCADLHSDKSFLKKWYKNASQRNRTLSIGKIKDTNDNTNSIRIFASVLFRNYKKMLITWTEGPLPHKLSNYRLNDFF